MTRGEAVRFVILRSLGNFLVLLSIYGVCATFGPVALYELQFRIIEARHIHFSIQLPKENHVVSSLAQKKTDVTPASYNPGFAQILAGSREQVLVPKDTQFGIVIPHIGANAKVFPNIDSTNPSDYLSILKQGVAHAKGTVFPGMAGTIYLFAHSTDNWWDVGRYNAVFYLLKDLRPGDDIVLFFENRRYNYVMTEQHITDPSDVSYLTTSRTGEQKVVLQTCWPPGTTWKRLFVVAVPKNN